MEAPEEVVEFAARTNERTSLPKRKRTKRQRDQSPFAFSIAGTPSEEKVGKVGPLSPANSSEVTGGDDIKEEEDMAHCLILLARGRLSGGHERKQLSAEEDDEANDDRRHDKFNSKRFLETGEYVFQCRTCDKVFPSFQALGGHRASHKKHKITTAPAMADDNKRQILSTSSPDDVTDDEDSLSLQLMNTRNSCPNKPSHNNNGKHITKVHECSICGAEFSSGQALGGHMRRHRPIMTGQTQPTLALTPKTPESEEPSRPRNNIKVPSLQLDLNLPAPEDDDPAEAGPFPLNSSGKERRDRLNQLVLSFPALVGYHY